VNRKRTSAVIAAVTAVAAAAAVMVASTPPAVARQAVTRGDVEAQFEAIENAGSVILSNKGFETTIPPAAVCYSIRPIAAFFEGRHYCELDWQLVTIALFVEPGLRELLEQTDVTFVIDGVPVPAEETTAVKPLLEPAVYGLPPGSLWRAWGNFHSPGDLTVGTHSLTGIVTAPIGTFHLDRIRFHIDPVGEGACP